VRRVGQQRAQDHHGVDVELLDDRQELGAERPPAHVGFDAVHQHHVAVAARWPAVGDPHRRPHQFAGDTVELADHRPIHLVVVVRLVVDVDDQLGFPDVVQVLHRIAGGVARVIPALERSHHDGVVQVGKRGAVIRSGHTARVRPVRRSRAVPDRLSRLGRRGIRPHAG